jgi:hypothetical protein
MCLFAYVTQYLEFDAYMMITCVKKSLKGPRNAVEFASHCLRDARLTTLLNCNSFCSERVSLNLLADDKLLLVHSSATRGVLMSSFECTGVFVCKVTEVHTDLRVNWNTWRVSFLWFPKQNTRLPQRIERFVSSDISSILRNPRRWYDKTSARSDYSSLQFEDIPKAWYGANSITPLIRTLVCSDYRIVSHYCISNKIF